MLQPFLDRRLNIILAPLDAPGLKHPEAVADLRSAIVDAMKKAPVAKQPPFQAALAVCNVLSQAVDERQRAVANLQGSQRFSGWPGLKHQAAREAAQNNAFFANAQITEWKQRAAQLRQQIEQLYTREREIEGHVTAAAADAAATANTITLDKPVAVKVKYGMATIPPGTTLTVISRDANGILVDYADEKVTLPP